MTNLHKIRARIRSVNSTQQITRTMKMIAVSKLRKTQTSLAGVRLFADKSQAVLNALLAGDASFEHPYLTPRRHVGRVCYVVFWGNRARQAAITTEISEIVGGSAALKKSDKSD